MLLQGIPLEFAWANDILLWHTPIDCYAVPMYLLLQACSSYAGDTIQVQWSKDLHVSALYKGWM